MANTIQAPPNGSAWAPSNTIALVAIVVSALVTLAVFVLSARQRKKDRENDHVYERDKREDDRREQRRREAAPAIGAVYFLLEEADPERLAGCGDRLAEIRRRWESEVGPRLSAVQVEFPSLAERRIAGELSREVGALLTAVEQRKQDEAHIHYEAALRLREELGAAIRGAARTLSGKPLPSFQEAPVENLTRPRRSRWRTWLSLVRRNS